MWHTNTNFVHLTADHCHLTLIHAQCHEGLDLVCHPHGHRAGAQQDDFVTGSMFISFLNHTLSQHHIMMITMVKGHIAWYHAQSVFGPCCFRCDQTRLYLNVIHALRRLKPTQHLLLSLELTVTSKSTPCRLWSCYVAFVAYD
jgi:hypothetical protein